MSAFETIKDILTFPMEGPVEKFIDGADAIGDGVAMGVDYLRGDEEAYDKHQMDLGIDLVGLTAPPGVDKAAKVTKLAKDLADTGKDEDAEGEDAKIGALLGLPWAPFGGSIIGAALGAGYGALKAPKAGHAAGNDLALAGANVGSQASEMAKAKPTQLDNYLAKHPFGHYAL